MEKVKIPFNKQLLINLPWLGSALFVLHSHYNYNREMKYFALLSLIALISQIFIWKEINLSYKINLAGWVGITLASFYYCLEYNSLFFLKTATVYYSTLILYNWAMPLLLFIQIAIWLFLLFRRFRSL